MSRRKKRAPKKKIFSEAKKQKEHLKRKRIREKLYYYGVHKQDKVPPDPRNYPIFNESPHVFTIRHSYHQVHSVRTTGRTLLQRKSGMSRRKKRTSKKKNPFSEAKKQKEHLKRKRIREKLYYYVMGYFEEGISVLPTRLSITVLDEKLYAGSIDILWLQSAKHNEILRYCFVLLFQKEGFLKG
ncbi:hypothetical protein CDAR_466941 [Caerostris darwini]|uniref:Ribosomal protein S14 n=1 Tax=Caerostris darwini TaxID=1538125 RepID=A0AAV4S9L6_9ARAC|nr:hypothetical protein CDAR_466941 [Caerostris darwini]